MGNNPYSIGDIRVVCKRTEKTGFGLALQKFVNLLSVGTASANGQQLL